MRHALLILLFAFALGVFVSGTGCAHTPAGTFVGSITYAASTDGCSVAVSDAATDDGARDDGKAEMHSVTVAADGAAVCVVGSGITDNLKAALSSAFGFLAGLML